MSSVRSFILYHAEHVAKAPVTQGDSLVFASVVDVKTFELMQGRIGKSFFGMLVGDSHFANAMHLLRHSYEAKAQYVKMVGERMQQPFVKKGRSIVWLADGSFAVDLNMVRKKAKEMYGDSSTLETVPILLFDSNYTGVGVIFDMARMFGLDVSAIERDTWMAMHEHDAITYSARWGGLPGEERFVRPYDMEP